MTHVSVNGKEIAQFYGVDGLSIEDIQLVTEAYLAQLTTAGWPRRISLPFPPKAPTRADLHQNSVRISPWACAGRHPGLRHSL